MGPVETVTEQLTNPLLLVRTAFGLESCQDHHPMTESLYSLTLRNNFDDRDPGVFRCSLIFGERVFLLYCLSRVPNPVGCNFVL